MLCGAGPGLHQQQLQSLRARRQPTAVRSLVALASRRTPKSSSGEIEARKPLFQRFADEGSLDSLDLAVSDWEDGLDDEFGAKVREIASQRFNLQKFVPSSSDNSENQEEANEDASSRAQPRRTSARPMAGWYAMPGLTVRDLYLGILQHCEQGSVDVAPLYAILHSARTEAEAGLCLSALSVCRIARLRRNLLEPFHPRLAANLVWMCVKCDAGDILVEAMERGPELGLQLSGRRVHMAMKLWGESGRLDLLARIYQAMPAAGVAVSGRTTYTIMRTAMNLGRYDWVLKQMEAFREQQVPIQSALESLAKVARERIACDGGSISKGNMEQSDLLESNMRDRISSVAF